MATLYASTNFDNARIKVTFNSSGIYNYDNGNFVYTGLVYKDIRPVKSIKVFPGFIIKCSYFKTYTDIETNIIYSEGNHVIPDGAPFKSFKICNKPITGSIECFQNNVLSNYDDYIFVLSLIVIFFYMCKKY